MRKSYFLASLLATIFLNAQNNNSLKPAARIDKGFADLVLSEGNAGYSRDNAEKVTESLVNFNPVALDYEKASSLDIRKDLGDLTRFTVFTVYVSDVSKVEQKLWNINGSDFQANLTNVSADRQGSNFTYEGGKVAIPVLSTYTQTVSSGSRNSDGSPSIILGDSSGNDGTERTKGLLAEVLVFDRILRGRQRQMVESALALKYGITLDNGKNYISSDKQVVFPVEEYRAFANRIAGIGRDDQQSLYQKQSRSTQHENVLALSIGSFAESNAKNPSSLDNGSFLSWGDNNGELTGKVNTDNALLYLQRHWLMKSTGGGANLSTTLKFDIGKTFQGKGTDASRYFLVRDRAGKDEFKAGDVSFIPATEVTENEITFSNIKWDEDASGMDGFTLAVADNLETKLSEALSQNCSSSALEYNVKGGMLPYKFELTKDNTVIKNWTVSNTSSDNKLENVASGVYKLIVTDALGDKEESSLELMAAVPVNVELGSERRFDFEQTEMYLEAQVTPADAQNLSYKWTADNGFTGTSQRARITQPGNYTLSVTTPKGCVTTDTVAVKESYVKSFSLYPNRSTDGNYEIKIELSEPMAFNVDVFDALGKRIDSFKANENKARTSVVKGKKINFTGYYTIVLYNEIFKVSKKLIVE